MFLPSVAVCLASWHGQANRKMEMSVVKGYLSLTNYGRLQEIDMEITRPLPSAGKVVVIHGHKSAEARMVLPVASTRTACHEELRPFGWMTIGLLATDGFVLQVNHALVILTSHGLLFKGSNLEFPIPKPKL
jgi:uncharacterized protein (DUF1684 family)